MAIHHHDLQSPATAKTAAMAKVRKVAVIKTMAMVVFVIRRDALNADEQNQGEEEVEEEDWEKEEEEQLTLLINVVQDSSMNSRTEGEDVE